MATLAQLRDALAAELSAVTFAEFTISARPTTANPRPGGGYVNLGPLTPAGYGHVAASLTVIIFLGTDIGQANERYEEWGPATVLALAHSELALGSIEVAPEALTVATTNSSVYAMTVQLSVEVD
jgi:hypothetical protein